MVWMGVGLFQRNLDQAVEVTSTRIVLDLLNDVYTNIAKVELGQHGLESFLQLLRAGCNFSLFKHLWLALTQRGLCLLQSWKHTDWLSTTVNDELVLHIGAGADGSEAQGG
jgi:hypothetical protein